MVSKTHISAQKPRARQLNAKVCGRKSAFFFHSSFILSSDHKKIKIKKNIKNITRCRDGMPKSMQTR